MKILLVGVLDVPWSTNIPMQRCLEGFGHAVDAFNYRTIAKDHSGRWGRSMAVPLVLDKACSYMRRHPRLPASDIFFKINGRHQMNQMLLDTVRQGNFDLVLLSKTDSMNYELLPEINRYAPTWYFFMDPMAVAMSINAKEYAKRATWASATFSDVVDHFQDAGSNVHWITQGLDPGEFSPRPTEKDIDVVFVGSREEKRERFVARLRRANIEVTCFGNGWENDAVYQNELANIYQRSKIVLNFCREGSGFSIRVFQVMGTGSFLLTEYCTDLESFFERRVHMDWFRDDDELSDRIDYYLRNDFEREQLAREGCALVHQRHTWEKSLNSMMKIVGEGQ